jgi:uncharacterized protein YjlB
MPVRVTHWDEAAKPSEAALREHMQREGLVPYAWSNAAFDHYAAHRHAYDKVIYVVSGSIEFGVPEEGTRIHLRAGDRLELPKETVHEATVGAQGVTCLEAHKD